MPHRTHYEALGLTAAATPEQIEQAYQFYSGMYEEQSVATYSLLEPGEMRDARARIRQAYEILIDPAQRQHYDAHLAEARAAEAEMAAPAPRVAPSVAHPAPAAAPTPGAAPRRAEGAGPRLLPEPVTGASLRKAREEQGISLKEIATASKIGVRFLEYIEADRHADLPALVYLRGFLQEYARQLGLEPRRTTESYLRRFASEPSKEA